MDLVVARNSRAQLIEKENKTVDSSCSEISEKSMTSRRSGRLAQRSNQKIIEDEDPIEEMMLDDTEDEEDDDDEYMSGRNKIQVGNQYQAILPDLVEEDKKKINDYRSKTKLEKLMWSPYLYDEKRSFKNKDKLQEYLEYATRKHYFSEVQALYVLNLCQYDVLAATRQIQNLAPLPDMWMDDEHDHFLELLSFIGKDFNLIAKKLPNRSTQDVVERFYKWKATVMKQLQDNKQNKSKKKNSKKSKRICEIDDESKGYPMPVEKSQYSDLRRELESKALNSALEMESFKCVDDHTIFDSCKAKLNKDYQNTRKEVQVLKQNCEQICKSLGNSDIPRPPKNVFI